MKKSQITVFIILGLVVVLSFGMVMYVKQVGMPSKKPEMQQAIVISADPVKKYVEQCLEYVSLPLIEQIALQGGKLEPKEFTYLKTKKINYLCIDELDNGCVNSLLLRQDIEKELGEEISKKLKSCIDLDVFRNQGFTVISAIPETVVNIADDELLITLNYPLKLTKKDIEINVDTFSAKINKPLGLLYKLAVLITNDEITFGYFDAVEFMNKYNLLIQKTRPYPNIIYSLTKEDFNFRFAIKGEDTVTNVGYSFYGMNKNKNGCCFNTYDKLCFENSRKEDCESRKGIYQQNCECEVPKLKGLDADLQEKKDCKNTYDRLNNNWKGAPRKNDESWCSYESPTGNSNDLVGSRHYMHYCIDGKEYVEPCRDYREEICVEKVINNEGIDKGINNQNMISKALCRPNRWQDCIECTTKECCEDNNYRDCRWNEFSTEKKCTPAVSPGFKFWGGNAIAICTRANLKKSCDGFSCPQEWVDDSAKLCYMQGDCGNYRNLNGILTKYGFINSDFKHKPTSEVYMPEKFEGEKKLNLAYDKKDTAKLSPYSYGEFINNHAELLSAGLSYVDEISSLSVLDIINPFAEKPAIHVLDVALCGLWQAPRTSEYCGYCTKNPLRPCSEYYCKSLGELCVFDYNYGEPLCRATKDDKISPHIEIDKSSLSAGYEIIGESFIVEKTKINGYKITPALKPYTPFSFGIKSNEPVTCKLAMTPVKKFNDLPSFYLGSQQFDTNHNISLRIPPNVIVPQKIMDALNFTHYTQLAQILSGPEEFINNYKEKYGTALRYYKLFTGDDISEKIDKIGEKVNQYTQKYYESLPYIKALITLSLDKFENNSYLFYVVCMDEAGNENSKPLFIEFSIDNNLTDAIAPSLIGVVPENNSLVGYDIKKQNMAIYLNEPSECRWSIEDKNYSLMENDFECATSIYKISSQFGGTYECSIEIPLHDGAVIFIRCKDQPEKIEEYTFNLEEGDANQIIGITNNMFLNITEQNNMTKIYASIVMLKDEIKVMAKEKEIELHLFKENPNTCWYETGKFSNELDYCIKNYDVHLGLYECITTINFDDLNKELVKEFNFRVDNEKGLKYQDEIKADEIINTLLLKEGNITIEFTEPYICRINNGSINCTENLCSTLISKNSTLSCMPKNISKLHKLNFKCPVRKPEMQNVDEESFVYVLKKSEPLEIISKSPEGEIETRNPIITVKTSKESAKCSYKTEFGLSYVEMHKKNDTFTAQLKDLPINLNTYIVRCMDEHGNKAEEKVEFYIVG